jgi:predicted DNA-binding transcriptional regulator YafY
MATAAHIRQRLDALRLALADGEARTLEALCDMLATSRRTLLRDVAALRDLGVPIESATGRGGGIRLGATHRAHAVSFASDEIVALWLTTTLARLTLGLPWGKAANDGLNRLFSTLPARRVRELRALCDRVVVGPLATTAVRESARAPVPELLLQVEQAFTHRYGLAFNYEDRHGARTRRRVEPHGLLLQVPVWYILAFDLQRDAPRAFRMDRISNPQVLSSTAFVPRRNVITALLP